MLASEHKLIGGKNFDLVKQQGTLYQSPDFGVQILKRNDDKPSRFGFIVSTKISKLAVHRNRVKRALREAVRQNMTGIEKNFDMVFLPKISITSHTTDQIMNQVLEFLDKGEFRK